MSKKLERNFREKYLLEMKEFNEEERDLLKTEKRILRRFKAGEEMEFAWKRYEALKSEFYKRKNVFAKTFLNWVMAHGGAGFTFVYQTEEYTETCYYDKIFVYEDGEQFRRSIYHCDYGKTSLLEEGSQYFTILVPLIKVSLVERLLEKVSVQLGYKEEVQYETLDRRHSIEWPTRLSRRRAAINDVADDSIKMPAPSDLPEISPVFPQETWEYIKREAIHNEEDYFSVMEITHFMESEWDEKEGEWVSSWNAYGGHGEEPVFSGTYQECQKFIRSMPVKTRPAVEKGGSFLYEATYGAGTLFFEYRLQ